MAKGVKKIRCVEGKYYPKMSVQNEKVVIVPDQFVYFRVSEWYPDTTEEEKKRDLTWMRQDTGRKTIIRQMTVPENKMYGVKLPKKLCGPYAYYVEASLFGKRDPANTGLYVNGHCPARIVSSKWSTRNGGSDERKSKKFAYGETVYLNLSTEGLNGCTDLSIEIYNIQNLRGDKRIFTYNRIHVTDGEINLEIRNTSSWQPLVSNIQEEEKFYIKVKNGRGQYIIDDNNDDIHARFLRIKNELVSNEPERPKNLTPVRIGKPQLNMERYEPCKFETISITEVEEKNGKAQQKKVVVFDNGKNLSKIRSVPELVNRTVYFTFDSAAIESQSRSVLDNTLRFLLEHEHSTITLNGYACVIGKADYNKALSLERSQAIKQYFTEGGLNPNRILSNGKGEILLNDNRDNDDKNGADNIKYKDEREYHEARRVDISFTFYGHDAQRIIYETIAPSSDRNITIDITGFETKSCFRNSNNKHRKIIRITSLEYTAAIEQESDSVQAPLHSALSVLNVGPLQYIWPKWNLISGVGDGGIDSAVLYNVYVNSCRYFTNEKKSTILIKAYPDIKWTFNFFLNLTNELSVSWQNMPAERHRELQRKAGKIGAERRWQQKDASFGFSLKAEWNKDTGGNFGREQELKLEYETKFKKIYSLFSSVGAMSDGITNKTKGQVRNIGFKGIPISFVVFPPNVTIGGVWYLEKIRESLGTNVNISFEADPLIGLEITIDLLCLGVGAVAGAVSGGTASGPAMQLYNQIKGTMNTGIDVGTDDFGFKASSDVFIDLVISSTIKTSLGFEFNTAGNREDTKTKLEATNTLKIELKAGIWVKAEANLVIVKVNGYFEMSAKGSAAVTFGHSVNYDDKGLYYRPQLGFDGIIAEYVVKSRVGLSSKRTIFGGGTPGIEEGGVISEGDFTVVPPFDVIESLEELFDFEANIPLIKND
ncbi:OmpA family protein [Sinomicrobium sp. M5D2P9]